MGAAEQRAAAQNLASLSPLPDARTSRQITTLMVKLFTVM
jgi:hypothetical protein